MVIERFVTQERFYHYFQPIYHLESSRVLGYEALLRSDEHNTPERTFELAQKEKMLYELDTRSIRKAVQSYLQAGFSENDGLLFLNVFPSTLLNPRFPSFIKNIVTKYSICQLLVLELCEQEEMDITKLIRDKIEKVKALGVRFAIDDVSKGSSSLQSIIELDPHFIKLDKYFSDGLESSMKIRDVTKFIVDYCKKHDLKLIVEGVESTDQLDIFNQLGVHFGQGFGLGKPSLLKQKAVR